MKKKYKIVLGTLAVLTLLMTATIYALIPEKRIGPPLKPIELAAYDLKGLKTAEQSVSLRTKVMQIEGVTACSVNKDNQMASVTFYPDVTNERNIQLALNADGAYATGKHQYPANVKGGCPVSGVQSFLDKIFN